MIDKLKEIVKKGKFLTITMTEQGDGVMITATLRTKSGSDQEKPLQVKSPWEIADVMLLDALKNPPKKAGKEEKREVAESDGDGDLFA